MKKNLLLILLIFTNHICTAQKIEKFYNYNWKPCEPANARFYSVIEFKDSLWSRFDFFIREKKLQMQGTYKDSASKIHHGVFYYFHANGSLQSTGKYINDKKEGLWLRYYSNGMMEDSTNYINSLPIGLSMSWHVTGYAKDSSVYNSNGTAVKVSWFDNGNASSAGRMSGDSMHGKWIFFHKNGNPSATETYDRGKLLSKEYFDEDGKAIDDTTNKDRAAEFKGGQSAWTKYMLSKLYFPDQYQITGADEAVVVISAVIDEEGNVTNAEVYTPFYPAFDEIALKMIKGSPKWKPAIHHNRKIKYFIRQPVTFQQSNE